MRKMILTSSLGDSTLKWSKDQDDKMLEFIQKKMKEGVTYGY